MTLMAFSEARRPQSAAQGLRQQLRNLPYVAVTEGQRFGGRPQHGEGARTKSVDKASESIAHLERMAERGDLPPVCLLLRCLQHLGSLELGCVGGDALLWMVSPVLEVARRRIQQDSHERFALQAEAESLRQTVEKIAMQVEDQQCLQQRTQDRFEALLKRHEQQLEAFRSEVTALKRQRSDVEVKRRQLDTEALAAERLWKAELQQLEEERWSLEKQLENLEEQMSSLAAPRQRAQDRCVELTEKLELLQPDLQKKETLRQTNLRIEGEIEDLEREIAQLEKRKKRPSRIGMNAKQHKKSTLR
ncbi:unnamed protein product [Cladocopium goreaui]|uniref:Dynein regulatory complex protein 10 n=1 Tax=Cladocopium goreaui TaxID=2562237 RepID=A0A9P1D8P0_9DINO|nr:unnamed protein product [Cladocopium goreaui]|mmetsp:Transcript_39858/g.86272  ORF Transcript_39858/g.86272 Transcript_39858/m.86272 type:complete len:304 (+) Transcript_39858:33-944(+)